MSPWGDGLFWDNNIYPSWCSYQRRIITLWVDEHGMIELVMIQQRKWPNRFRKTGVCLILALLLIMYPFTKPFNSFGELLTLDGQKILLLFGGALYIWLKISKS